MATTNSSAPLSPKARQALQIVRDHGPIQPREFARKMWPSSEGWKRHHNCGPNGSHQGGGMYLTGGSYLGKLRRKGWVQREWDTVGGRIHERGYILTPAGEQALAAAPAEGRDDG